MELVVICEFYFSDGSSGRSSIDSGFASEPDDEIDEIREREQLPPTNMVLRKRIRRIRQGMKRYICKMFFSLTLAYKFELNFSRI